MVRDRLACGLAFSIRCLGWFAVAALAAMILPSISAAQIAHADVARPRSTFDCASAWEIVAEKAGQNDLRLLDQCILGTRGFGIGPDTQSVSRHRYSLESIAAESLCGAASEMNSANPGDPPCSQYADFQPWVRLRVCACWISGFLDPCRRTLAAGWRKSRQLVHKHWVEMRHGDLVLATYRAKWNRRAEVWFANSSSRVIRGAELAVARLCQAVLWSAVQLSDLPARMHQYPHWVNLAHFQASQQNRATPWQAWTKWMRITSQRLASELRTWQ